MRDLTNILLIGLLIAATLGCGIVDRVQREVSGTDNTSTNSNKSLEDRAVDVAVGDTKIGIKECDETIEILNEQINNPDDNFVVKAAKRTMLNQFRDQLKRSLEENNTNKQDVAKFCAEFKKNLMETKAESNANKS